MIQYLMGINAAKLVAVEKDLLGAFIASLQTGSTNTGSKGDTVAPGEYAELSAGVIGDLIYIYGGITNSAFTGRLITYNPVTGKTTALADGLARSMAMTVVFENKLYAFGGRTSAGVSNVAQRFDPATGTWITLTKMPAALYGGGIFVYNKKIYIVSGYTGSVISPSIYVYNPVTNTYTTVSISSTTYRTYGAAFGMINDLFYFVGGYSNPTLCRIYNPATNTWTTGRALPDGRYFFDAVVCNNKLYVFGGYNVTLFNWFNTPQSDVFGYDPKANTWTALNGPFTSINTPLVVCRASVYWLGNPYYRVT